MFNWVFFWGLVSIFWGVSGWFVSNLQSPFSGSSVVFHLLKLDLFFGSVCFVFETKK